VGKGVHGRIIRTGYGTGTLELDVDSRLGFGGCRKQKPNEFTPTPVKNEELIVNTLLQMKANGRAESTMEDTNLLLTVLSRTADLSNPEEVKLTIANRNIQNGAKDNYAKAYTNLARANQIQWKRPTYKVTRRIPQIPTRENLMKIISASKKYATIFKVLMETGLMPYELSQVE
jgi:hypothetical protein